MRDRVSPVVTEADRETSTDSASPNLRDLGGLEVAEGRTLREGIIFRSEAPGGLGGPSRSRLEASGIRLVCDLRGPRERVAVPFAWSDPDIFLIPDDERDGSATAPSRDPKLALDSLADRSGGAAREFMADGYRSFPLTLAEPLRGFFGCLLEGRVPALIHCAAGKDRTGFCCAVLLSVLGSPWSVIEADYLRSNAFFGAERIVAVLEDGRDVSPSGPVVDSLLCRAEYLRIALESAADMGGSLDGYIEGTLGLDQRGRERLRSLLLAPAP